MKRNKKGQLLSLLDLYMDDILIAGTIKIISNTKQLEP